MKKERLDVLLVKKGLASSREKAKAIIMSGIVFVDGQREDKAGSQLFLKMIFMNLRMHSYRLENRQRRSTMLVCIRILMIWLENT